MELRNRIIKAAIELFGEFGYEKTTIAHIVKKSGSSKGGFYHHFDSKKDILDEINSRYLNEVIDGCNDMIENSGKDTIYLLNNVFLTVNNFKKQRLGQWKELTNMYAHKDSESIRMKTYFDFIDLTAEIYEKLILRGIDEGLFSPSSPKSLAGMWSREVTLLYGSINSVIINDGDKKLYDDFIRQAHFIEETINYALNAGSNIISIVQPAKEYLDMAIDMMKQMKNKS